MGLEMMGIEGIIDDGNPHPSVNATGLQGLAVASHPLLEGASGGSYSSPAALAFEDLQQVIDQIATTSDYSESDIGFIFSNYACRRAYYKLCIAERRHVNTMNSTAASRPWTSMGSAGSWTRRRSGSRSSSSCRIR